MSNFEYCKKVAFEVLKCKQITTGTVEGQPVTVEVLTEDNKYISFDSKKDFVAWVKEQNMKGDDE